MPCIPESRGEAATISWSHRPFSQELPGGGRRDGHVAKVATDHIDEGGCVEKGRRRVGLDLLQHGVPRLSRLIAREHGAFDQGVYPGIAVPRDVGATGAAPSLAQARRRRILTGRCKIDVELSGCPALHPDGELELAQLNV